MIISRPIYDALNERAIKAEAVRDALILHNATLSAHIEWMRVRVTELSLERAAMMKRYLNIDIPVASFEEERVPFSPDETISFNDVGDEAAAKLGIGWTAEGRVEYAKQ